MVWILSRENPEVLKDGGPGTGPQWATLGDLFGEWTGPSSNRFDRGRGREQLCCVDLGSRSVCGASATETPYAYRESVLASPYDVVAAPLACEC